MRPDDSAEHTLERLVEEFVSEALGMLPGDIHPNLRITADLDMDSLDLLELAIEAQGRFGVEIDDEALDSVETVGDFDRCLIEAIRGSSLAS